MESALTEPSLRYLHDHDGHFRASQPALGLVDRREGDGDDRSSSGTKSAWIRVSRWYVEVDFGGLFSGRLSHTSSSFVGFDFESLYQWCVSERPSRIAFGPEVSYFRGNALISFRGFPYSGRTLTRIVFGLSTAH